MSYLTQAQDPRRRAAAIAGTVAVHAALGVAIVTGLTIAGVGPIAPTRIDTFDVSKPQPPPPPDPKVEPEVTPQRPQVAEIPQIKLVEPPEVRVDVVDPVRIDPEVIRLPDPPVRIDPQPPVARFTPQSARPSNRPASWISNNDYPRSAIVDESEGTARYRVIVSTTGRVSSCELIASTGDRALDAATCNLISRRARFEPATDENGAKVMGSYTGTVRWQIPE